MKSKQERLEHLTRNATHETRAIADGTTEPLNERLAIKKCSYTLQFANGVYLCEKSKYENNGCSNCFIQSCQYQKRFGIETLCERYK